MKSCTKCGDSKPLRSQFYRNSKAKDGLRTTCKICDNETRALRKKNNPEQESRYQQLSYLRRDPIKLAARRAVTNAITTGKLTKLPCACGSTDVEAHHPDYSKPLDVTWMCNKCHRKSMRY